MPHASKVISVPTPPIPLRPPRRVHAFKHPISLGPLLRFHIQHLHLLTSYDHLAPLPKIPPFVLRPQSHNKHTRRDERHSNVTQLYPMPQRVPRCISGPILPGISPPQPLREAITSRTTFDATAPCRLPLYSPPSELFLSFVRGGQATHNPVAIAIVTPLL